MEKKMENIENYAVSNFDEEGIDDANIPIRCYLFEYTEEDDDKCFQLQKCLYNENGEKLYKWAADNYMPRKGRIAESEYIIIDTLPNIKKFITEKVIPLYKSAIANLEKHCELHCWEVKE